MKNSLEQARAIRRGPDGGQSVYEMFQRIKTPESQAVFKRAYQVRTFFSSGWFRLWRKDVLNKKVDRRDRIAFSECEFSRRELHESGANSGN